VTGVTTQRWADSCEPLSMDLRDNLQRELDRLEIGARAVVIPTDWDIGPVAAYLFPDDPVTFVDGGVDTPQGREAISAALGAEGLEPVDVRRVLVTHMHSDHFGGARWLQELSACEVFVHEADLGMLDSVNSKEVAREMFMPLGFDEELLERFTEGEWHWRPPVFKPLGSSYVVGDTTLRVEHHPGHSPGHVWVIDERTQAIFIGDYLLANMPTNAGMEIDRSHTMGRQPLLQQYNAGLAELHDRETPALFPAHGPVITDHRALIEKRLAKSARRTRHVFAEVRNGPPSTAIAIGRRLWGSRVEQSWEVLADLVGRLDLLTADGLVVAQMGEDGCWYFRAAGG
jgi:glyoxylase-like metal-dependent hydrolase (beta-lactamase superfamily II)